LRFGISFFELTTLSLMHSPILPISFLVLIDTSIAHIRTDKHQSPLQIMIKRFLCVEMSKIGKIHSALKDNKI